MKYFVSYFWWHKRWPDNVKEISNDVITLNDQDGQINDYDDICKIEKFISDKKGDSYRSKIINIQPLPIK